MPRAAYLLLLGTFASLLTSCSTVESVDLAKTAAPARAGAYLNYSVAQSLFTIQIAAAATGTGTAPAPAPAPAAGAAPAVPNAAPATQTTSVAAQPATDSSVCGALNAEYSAAQTQVSSEISTYSLLKVRLALMAAGQPANGDSPTQLATDLGKYVATVNSASYLALLDENGGSPPGGAAQNIYSQIVTGCPPKVTVTVQQSIVPDTTRTFALKVNTNIFYSDGLALSTDSNGFLTNGAPSSTSQVTAIASAVAGDAGEFSPVGLKLPGILPEMPQPGAPAVPACPSGATNNLAQLLTALACAPAAAIPGIAQAILINLSTPGSLQNLPASMLPVTLYASIGDLSADPAAPASSPYVQQQLSDISKNYAVQLALECSPRGPVPADGLPENAPQNATPGLYAGLVVSAPRACMFEALQKRSAINLPVLLTRNYLWTQDSRYLTILPTRRGFLVQRSVAYTFANGQSTGVTDSRPSEALAFVSFPGAVIGSFFTGISAGVTNSQAYTTGKTSDLTAQTNYLTAQTNYLSAKSTAQKAEAAAPASP